MKASACHPLEFLTVCLGWNLRIHIVSRLPRATDAAGLGPHFIAAVEGGGPCPLPHLHLGSRKVIRVGWIVNGSHPMRGTKALRRPGGMWMGMKAWEGLSVGTELLPGAAL